MTSEKENPSISLARQPVFDADQTLWGYELLAVSNSGPFAARDFDADTVAGTLASSTYMGLQQMLERGRKIIVRFSEEMIMGKLPYALPPKRTAVKIKGGSQIRPEFEKALVQLKEDGYLILLADTDATTAEALFQLADILDVSVADLARVDLTAIQAKVGAHECRFLADQVHDQDLMTACKDKGFSLFQGAFFKQPEKISVKQIPSNEASRFQLMRLIENEDPDLDQLTDVISTDVSITFRLFSYINSAAFGFRQKIQSIRDAVNMLGWKKIRNWIRVVILNDMAKNQKGSELVVLSAQRGKLLEQIAIDHDYWGFNPESLFLLGMFSLLEAMINCSMVDIVQYLPLDDKLKAALCGDSNNEYLPLLHLVEYIEDGQWGEAKNAIQKLGLDGDKVWAAYYKSLMWGNEINELSKDR